MLAALGASNMMEESSRVQQIPGEPHRRWFSDDFFDLIVWVRDNEVIGFQLCYDKQGTERALSWSFDAGFHHHRVDTGEWKPPYKASPLLVADGPFDHPGVTDEFIKRSGHIDSAIAEFIRRTLFEYE